MKTTWSMLLCGIVVSVFAAGSVLAQEEAAGTPGDRPANPEREARRLERMTEMFTQMDANKDGSVDMTEYKAADERRMAQVKERMGERFDATRFANRPPLEETFKTIDKDADKKISKAEFLASPAAMGMRGGVRGEGRPEGGRRGAGGAGGPQGGPGGPGGGAEGGADGGADGGTN